MSINLRQTAAGLGLGIVLSFPVVAWSLPDAPHQFADGDVIVADELNENFQHLADGVTAAEGVGTPIGSVVAWAGVPGTLPSGWLLCDGAEHPNAAYPDLAAAIGSAHGGDGATTFRLPDLRGRFLRGVDGGAGRDPDALARSQPQEGVGNAGDAVGSVQSDQFGTHFHGTPSNFPNNQPGPGAFGNGSAGNLPEVMYAANAGPGDAQNSGSAGGGETRPQNAYVHFIIRAE